MRLLVANGNTSAQVTAIVSEAARAASRPGTLIVAVTAPLGVTVIESAADLEVARRACLQVVLDNVRGCDAVLVAVSLDTAVDELTERCAVPVVGMTSAALAAARGLGEPTGVLTMGAEMKELFLERFGSAAVVHAIDLQPSQALTDRRRAVRMLAEGVGVLVQKGAKSVIPVGATVAGLAGDIARLGIAPVPILDSIQCGVALAERLVDEWTGRSG